MSTPVDLGAMTAEERLQLLADLWDSLDSADVPISPAQREELDRRIEECTDGDPPGIPWIEVLEKIRTRKQ